MLSALLLMIVITTINGKPYTLNDEVSKLLERRGKPVVCDVDNSGVVAFVFDTADGTNDFPEQKKYVEKIIKFLPDNGKVSVSAIVYGGTATEVMPLGSAQSYDDLVAKIGSISEEVHGPRNEAGALEAAKKELAGSDGIKAVVLFVDGNAQDANAAATAADGLRDEEFKIFLAFPKEQYGPLESELHEIGSEPFSQSLNPMNSLVLAESLGIAFGAKYSC
ncbi:uncharacterized protein [Argopecten irradians]|uniref:uncharacterized protein n=1 Tax=Argopecten irradians TaxID=31199 RepID=UPI0037120C7C